MREHSVFVIDDDDAVRDSILCLLRAQGVRTRAFASGVQFFENLPDVPSACVITDVRMPGIDEQVGLARRDRARHTQGQVPACSPEVCDNSCRTVTSDIDPNGLWIRATSGTTSTIAIG